MSWNVEVCCDMAAMMQLAAEDGAFVLGGGLADGLNEPNAEDITQHGNTPGCRR